MATRVRARASKPEPIYQWPVRSMTDRQTLAGTTFTYLVLLYADGTLYCDCPRWMFGGKKTCKHCDFVRDEARERFSEFRRGDFSRFVVIDTQIPTVAPGTVGVQTVTAVPVPSVPVKAKSTSNRVLPKYGRVIEM